MKVLIVDDSRTMRNFLAAIVQDLAAEPVLAEGGEQGLRCLDEAGPFEVALVDWDMPGMNGISFVHRVRSRPEWSDTKLMMVTARTNEEAVIEAVTNGADDYLMKPLTAAMVEEKFRILGLLG
jgi:two-component system chemotaxis response regulator CheY